MFLERVRVVRWPSWVIFNRGVIVPDGNEGREDMTQKSLCSFPFCLTLSLDVLTGSGADKLVPCITMLLLTF